MPAIFLFLSLLIIFSGCQDSQAKDLVSVGLTCSSDNTKVCQGDTFCQFKEGHCALSSIQTGVCTEVPEACFELYEPVCGCDNKTYGNSCYASAKKISVLHQGECTDNLPNKFGKE